MSNCGFGHKPRYITDWQISGTLYKRLFMQDKKALPEWNRMIWGYCANQRIPHFKCRSASNQLCMTSPVSSSRLTSPYYSAESTLKRCLLLLCKFQSTNAIGISGKSSFFIVSASNYTKWILIQSRPNDKSENHRKTDNGALAESTMLRFEVAASGGWAVAKGRRA